MLVVIGGGVLFVFVGTDFFPSVDAGLIQLHVRAPARTRIERTEQIFQAIEDNIRTQIPAKDLQLILDNIGLPARTYNLAFTDGSTIGVNDGIIQIELADGHEPTAEIIKKLRAELARAFPDVLFYFQPADLVTQVLNFGVPTQIDVQVQGHDRENNKEIAALLQQKMANIPGLVDVHIQQELNAPEMFYTIDRTRAQELGLNMQEVANNLNISLVVVGAGLAQFLDRSEERHSLFHGRANPGVSDHQQESARQHAAGEQHRRQRHADSQAGSAISRRRKRVAVQSVFNQSNIQPVYDVYGSVQNRDLGSVAAAIQKIVEEVEPQLKPGNHIVIRGQIESMQDAFGDLEAGAACSRLSSSTC